MRGDVNRREISRDTAAELLLDKQVRDHVTTSDGQ